MTPASDSPLLLRILTPAGIVAEQGCESVQLQMAEDAQGRKGGSLGIRHGHAPAVIALKPGPVTAMSGGKTLLTVRVCGGFASVKDSVVTIVTDGTEDEEA